MRIGLASVAALAAFSQPASAEWLQAKSRHFTIYSDTSRPAVEELARRLESVDGALRYISGIPASEDAAANPVTVYVVDDLSAIRRLAKRNDIAGFYIPRADGAVAFTPRRGDGVGLGALNPQIVLFHEYAHHFLLGNSAAAYPAWLSEGYAEFVSTAKIDDRGVLIGGAAQHRAYGLYASMDLPLATLFAPGPRASALERDQVYSRGWLLTHYLLLNAERRPQLGRYLTAMNSGTPALKAATDAFGDLRALDRALDAYVKQRTLSGLMVGKDKLAPVAVAVRPLTPGERALVDMRMVSTKGVDLKTATALYTRALKAAAPYPNDPVAQGWLAEMAYDAGRDDEAEAATDRALAADPKSVQALLYKGRVHLRRAQTAGTRDPKIWSEARSWIVRANRVDPNNAAAFQLFHQSFEMADAKPAKSAAAGVHRALELAPQDPGLRFRSARQHLADGEMAEAKRALRPLAFNPHAGPDNPAAKLIALIDAGTTATAAMQALEAQEKGAADKATTGGTD